jgi:pantothenate kinase type III
MASVQRPASSSATPAVAAARAIARSSLACAHADVADSTPAITSGAIHALCGAVERMRREMIAAGHPEPTLVFGGGAADLVVQQLGRPARIVDKLVLEGLVQIAMESR